MAEIEPATDLAIERSNRGRRGHTEGHAFEQRVAEVYRLLHYAIEHGRLFGGRQVDLFLTGRFGDLTIHRAIECKVGAVKAEEIDSFIAKLRRVRREFPAAQGTIVSGLSFTDAIKTQASEEGIALTLFRDLAAQLFDGHSYVHGLMREAESNDRYRPSLFIEPLVGYESLGEGLSAFDLVKEWLEDSEWRQLTLLGDVGTGKSFLSRMISLHLAKRFLEAPLENPIPILIDLRNADRQFSLEGLVLTHFAANGLSQATFEIFQHALTQGQIVLILDGFDEMAARVTPAITNRNFNELSRCVAGRAKVLLTCRTHYFKSRTEEEEVILGTKQDYGSETARDLYWELIARKGFKIAYLRPFEMAQVEAYVRKVKPNTYKQALAKIRTTYNLMELSQRPMLLEMIVKSLDALKAQEINAATLYKVFTDAWVHRDKWRDVLSAEAKLSLLTALARTLWQEDLLNIHHSRLADFVTQELAAQIQNAQQFFEIDNEIRTASFLTRDEGGNYGFAHRSYAEFFFACYLAQELEQGRSDCLYTRLITPEVAGFLRDLISAEKVEPVVEAVLLKEYKPLVSENALVCLYSYRRFAALNKAQALSAKEFIVELPEHMNLSGAQLTQVTLEGAVLRRTDFAEANLSEAILSNTDLTDAVFDRANLEKADLRNSNLTSGKFASAQLYSANLENAIITGADFRKADLRDAYLLGADVERANFEDARFPDAVLPEDYAWLETPERVSKLRSRLSSHGQLNDEDWEAINRLRPQMLRAARLAGLATGEEAHDVGSEILVRIIQTQNINEFLSRTEKEQLSHIHWHAKDVVQARERSRLPVATDVSEVIVYDFEDDEVELGDYLVALASSDESPFERVVMREIREHLSPDLWRLIELHYLYGYSVREIANSSEKPPVMIQRGLSKARELIRKYFLDPN